MHNSTLRSITSVAAAATVFAGAAAATAGAEVTPAPATGTSSAARQYEGTVVSVNRDARTYRRRDTERGTVRVRVTRSTRFERLAGLTSLKRGMGNIEATVRRSDGQWVAIEVERSGGGGDHDDRDDDD